MWAAFWYNGRISNNCASTTMIMKLFHWGWRHKKQIATYGFVGSSSVILDLGLLAIFKEFVFESAALSVAVAQLIVLAYNFTLHRVFTFESKGMVKKQLVRYSILTTWNYLVGVIVMYIFADSLGFDPIYVRLATTGLVITWNFLLLKYWIYA